MILSKTVLGQVFSYAIGEVPGVRGIPFTAESENTEDGLTKLPGSMSKSWRKRKSEIVIGRRLRSWRKGTRSRIRSLIRSLAFPRSSDPLLARSFGQK